MGNALQKLPEIPPSQPHPQGEQEEGEEVNEDASETQEEFTCQICIEPVTDPRKKFNNGGDECSHRWCTDCMIKYIRVKLEDDHEGNIKCPAPSCEHVLNPLSCAPLVGPSLFVRWCDVRCEAAILGSDKCYCPHRDCNELILNECGGNPKKSKCPKCKRLFCFQCSMVWHAGFRCEESEELRDANDVAFGRLAELKKWRRCPRCKHFVERRYGCRVIFCRCGTGFCYRCGNQLQRCSCSRVTTLFCRDWCQRAIWVFTVMILFTFVTWLNKRMHSKKIIK